MTREQAVKWVKFVHDVLYEDKDEEIREALRMAIEALSADAIHIHNDGTLEVKTPNAQKVGRVLVMDTDSHIGGGLFYPDDAEVASAEAVQGWIPVSERLPSDDGQYLVFYEGTIIGSCIETMLYGEPLMPNVDVSGKHFYSSDAEWGDIIYDEVIAWIPLPEPYKGGESDE